MSRLIAYSFLTLVLAACSDNTAPDPADLTDSPGDPVSRVTTFGVTPIAGEGVGLSVVGLNDAGQVAGTLEGTEPRPFVWENGTFALVPDAGGRAADINAGGTLVGVAQETDAPRRAVIWPAGLGAIDLPVPAGTTVSEAHAVNDDGMIAGWLGTAGWHVWSNASDADPTPLTTASGSILNIGAFSNRGRLVGVLLAPAKNDFRAVYWPDRFSSGIELKGFDGGPCYGFAADINEHDEIVGGCAASTTDPVFPAYWADPDAVPIDLGAGLTGGAASINELGQILGHSTLIPKLWMREGDAFRPFTIGTPGEGVLPVSINNRGQAVGIRGNPATAYLWSIPIAARVAVAAGGGKPIKLDRKGVVAVTIFGSRWLRTADLDPATLTLGNDDGLETAGMRKKGQPVVRSTDANGDGFADLVVDFDERTLMNQHDLVAGQELVYLLGRFRDGTHVRGAAPLD